MPKGLSYRLATEADLPAVVALLNDDEYGKTRNPPFEAEPERYRSAFEAMGAHGDNQVIVALLHGAIVGCYQLTYIRGLSHLGGLRAQIESVRVSSVHRNQGIGQAMMLDAVTRAKAHGCFLAQLTTDTRRERTRRFYERLGFIASHHGMKLKLGMD